MKCVPYLIQLVDVRNIRNISNTVYSALVLSNLLEHYQVSYFYPTDEQLDCSKRILKFTLKFTLKCSYMFQFNNHHQRATIRALLKL